MKERIGDGSEECDLDKAILAWRKQMSSAGMGKTAVLDELECHLRQSIDTMVSSGKPVAESFREAVARIGNGLELGREYAKIGGVTILPVKIGGGMWLAGLAALILASFREGAFPAANVPNHGLLALHIISITAAYGAAFVMGGLAICWACLAQGSALSPVRENSLERAILWFSRIGIALMLAGTITGFPISRELFGSYWSSTPRETGGMCALGWFAAIACMWNVRPTAMRIMIFACILGNIVVSVAWFCPIFGVKCLTSLAIVMALHAPALALTTIRKSAVV